MRKQETQFLITVTHAHTLPAVVMGKACKLVGGSIAFHPVGTGEVDRCMFFSPFTDLSTPTTPSTPHTHMNTLTKVARVQSRVHKDPSELNKLAPFQRLSHLTCTAHNSARASMPSSPHTHRHITRTHFFFFFFFTPAKNTG